MGVCISYTKVRRLCTKITKWRSNNGVWWPLQDHMTKLGKGNIEYKQLEI